MVLVALRDMQEPWKDTSYGHVWCFGKDIKVNGLCLVTHYQLWSYYAIYSFWLYKYLWVLH